jgi:DHA3 family macrolide efflux protein-like MFS transporter
MFEGGVRASCPGPSGVEGQQMTAPTSVPTHRGAGPLLALTATQGLSAAGDLVTLTALTIGMQARDGGPLLLTMLVVASLLPGILIGPTLSHLVDRFDAGTVLKVGLLARALLVLSLSVSSDTAVMLLLFLAASTVSVLENPAMLTLAPAVKPEDMEASKVYARLALFRNLGAIAGPVAAGAFVAAGSVQLALALDAASSLVLAAVVQLARLRSSAGKEETRDPLQAAERPGVGRLLRSGDGVGASVWVLAMAILFTAALPVAQAQFMLKDLAMGPTLYGEVLASYAAGRLAASLLASLVTAPARPTTLLLAACLIMGTALATAALVPLVPVIFVVFFLAGAANTQQVLSIRTIVHDATPPAQLGSTFTSLGAVNNSATLLGVIIGGSIAGIASGTTSLLIAGTGTIAAVVIIKLVRSQRQRLPDRSPGDPVFTGKKRWLVKK